VTLYKLASNGRCNIKLRVHVLDICHKVTICFCYLITMSRKESCFTMTIVRMDLDQEHIPLHFASIKNTMPCIIDVDVVS